jgi:crotonobetainyl-CoA:carnitine CoA-transferase CaiB-like acyl-CoA transferase
MFECMAGFNLVEHLYGRQFAPPLGDMGYPRVLSSHRRPYRTRDGYICMLPYTDAHWRAFFAEAGAAGHATEPRFATMAARTANIDQLYELAADLIARHSSSHWLAACERIGVPASPVLSLDELIDVPAWASTSARYWASAGLSRPRQNLLPVLPTRWERRKPESEPKSDQVDPNPRSSPPKA